MSGSRTSAGLKGFSPPAAELSVPGSSAVGALDKFHFASALGLYPEALAHLLGSQRVRASAALRQIWRMRTEVEPILLA